MFSVKIVKNKSPIELQQKLIEYAQKRRRHSTCYYYCCNNYYSSRSYCCETINPFNIIIFKSNEQLKFEGGGGDTNDNVIDAAVNNSETITTVLNGQRPTLNARIISRRLQNRRTAAVAAAAAAAVASIADTSIGFVSLLIQFLPVLVVVILTPIALFKFRRNTVDSSAAIRIDFNSSLLPLQLAAILLFTTSLLQLPLNAFLVFRRILLVRRNCDRINFEQYSNDMLDDRQKFSVPLVEWRVKPDPGD